MQSKNSNTYIIPSHITYFSVEQLTIYDEDYGTIVVEDPALYEVIAHLDSYHQRFSRGEELPQPAQLTVFQGSESECHKFVKSKLRRQEFLKWVGYVVAGLVGSVVGSLLTLWFS